MWSIVDVRVPLENPKKIKQKLLQKPSKIQIKIVK